MSKRKVPEGKGRNSTDKKQKVEGDEDLDNLKDNGKEETKEYEFNYGKDPNKPARVYVDGIFDLFHFGHARALEQAKKLFPHVYLIVGVCNDELTHKLKGKTVMTDKERAESLRHCRYVDEVVENAPWIVDKKFMDEHQIDWLAHGQDPCLDAEGNDIYQFAKDIGRFQFINRTEGISTSDLILRVIREYDAYVFRNLNRGYTRKDLQIGLLREKKIVYGEKLRKLKDKAKEELNDSHMFEFLKKFGDYLTANMQQEKFPC